MKMLALKAAAVAVLAASAVLHQVPASSHPGDDLPFWVDTPCQTDDSVNCNWNAQVDGNGTGHSYIVRQFPGDARMVCVMYVDRQYARHHDYCVANKH